MARGWESKSVEAQIEESGTTKTDGRRGAPSAEDLERKRKVAELKLSHSRVAQQLEASSNERYSEMLRRALADLEQQIAALGN